MSPAAPRRAANQTGINRCHVRGHKDRLRSRGAERRPSARLMVLIVVPADALAWDYLCQ